MALLVGASDGDWELRLGLRSGLALGLGLELVLAVGVGSGLGCRPRNSGGWCGPGIEDGVGLVRAVHHGTVATFGPARLGPDPFQ